MEPVTPPAAEVTSPSSFTCRPRGERSSRRRSPCARLRPPSPASPASRSRSRTPATSSPAAGSSWRTRRRRRCRRCRRWWSSRRRTRAPSRAIPAARGGSARSTRTRPFTAAKPTKGMSSHDRRQHGDAALHAVGDADGDAVEQQLVVVVGDAAGGLGHRRRQQEAAIDVGIGGRRAGGRRGGRGLHHVLRVGRAVAAVWAWASDIEARVVAAVKTVKATTVILFVFGMRGPNCSRRAENAQSRDPRAHVPRARSGAATIRRTSGVQRIAHCACAPAARILPRTSRSRHVENRTLTLFAAMALRSAI